MVSGDVNVSQGRGSIEPDADKDPFVEDVATAVAVVFASIQPTRDDLVVHALRHGAHPRIVAALQALPHRRYRTLRQVRIDLLRQRRR